MKKLIFPILIFIYLLFNINQALATQNNVNIYFFWGEGCPHCEKQKPFLEKLAQENSEIKVYSFEVWRSAENRKLFAEIGQKLNINIGGVPLTIIGDQSVVGYYNDQITGQEIKNKVNFCLNNKCPDPVGEILGLNSLEPIIEAPEKEPITENRKEAEISDQVDLYFFWSSGCPLCTDQKKFLEEIKDKYNNLKIHSYDLSAKKENVEIYKKVITELSIDTPSVPLTVIGQQYFIGWYNQEKTGKLIEETIECAIETGCPNIVGALISSVTPETKPSATLIPEKIKVPILGEIQTKNLSLPLFAIVMGGIDGFNPCAMWVLLFLITLLVGMKNKKRMWILGSAFIFASGAVYFLFMAAWLKLFLFVGFIVWVRAIIGLVALIGGIYNFREFFVNKDGACKVTGGEKKQKVFEKLKIITQKQSFWLALGGIILLAAAVNLVELICSAGLPVVFTQVLALSNLSTSQYYLYMLLYIFVFILDDLFVFLVAMTTLRITGLTTKYTRFSHLIGGILMLIIGLMLIFKPEWLMFG